MPRTADDSRPAYTPKQGQYLAFIYTYTLLNGRAPAEADMMQFFGPPLRLFIRWCLRLSGQA